MSRRECNWSGPENERSWNSTPSRLTATSGPFPNDVGRTRCCTMWTGNTSPGAIFSRGIDIEALPPTVTSCETTRRVMPWMLFELVLRMVSRASRSTMMAPPRAVKRESRGSSARNATGESLGRSIAMAVLGSAVSCASAEAALSTPIPNHHIAALASMALTIPF